MVESLPYQSYVDAGFLPIEKTAIQADIIYLMPFETFAPPESEIRAFRDVIFPQLRDAGLR